MADTSSRWTAATSCCWTIHITATGRAEPAMLDVFFHPLTLGFMQRALVASVLVGGLTALVGAYVVLKGLAFIGDAISHAAFPGIVIAFMLKLPIYPGAVIAALLTAVGV